MSSSPILIDPYLYLKVSNQTQISSKLSFSQKMPTKHHVVLLAALLVIWLDSTRAQMDCSKAPSASLRTVCEQINNWDKNARVSHQEIDQSFL
jgi:hypothetical protein